MSKPRDERQDDLFRPALDTIIDLGHPLVRLAREVDWAFIAQRFASVCASGPGQPPLPTRLVAGLLILKHMHSLSDEALCARWIENPYYQYFCGEAVFRHELPFDRSSLTRWRQRLGEDQLVALIQESLVVAHKTGALATRDLERVAVDTTVQPKAIAHPTDARLMHRAIEKLVALAGQEGVPLRQSYRRVAKRATIMVGRYIHAHQFKRARRALKFLRTRLGRLVRDIRHKIDGNPALEARFTILLDLAAKVRHQDQRQRGPKVYSLHAPEVECTRLREARFGGRRKAGKGKARAPYEFGCKVSVATPVTRPKGGQFVLHTQALHGNPFDGHTLGPVVADMERLTGVEVRRIHVDKGYRGHNHPNRFRISGQVRRVTHSPPRDEAPRRGRAGDRALEGRAPHGSHPPQGLRRRPRQRGPRRRRLQLCASPPLIRSLFARPLYRILANCSPAALGLKRRVPGFVTDDDSTEIREVDTPRADGQSENRHQDL